MLALLPLLLAGLHLGGGVARAHPFDSAWYGQQLEARLEAGSLEVDYRVEVPSGVAVGWLARAARQAPERDLAEVEAELIARELQDLEQGLRLEIDGELRDWERLEVGEGTGEGDDRFVRFALRLRATLQPAPHSLRIFNGNHPDEPTLFHLSLLVDDSVVVDASSLYTVEEGELVRDATGEWRGEEAWRELTLAWRPRSPLALRVVGLLRQGGGAAGPAWRPGSEVLVGVAPGSWAGLPGVPAEELAVVGLLGGLAGAALLLPLAWLRRRARA